MRIGTVKYRLSFLALTWCMFVGASPHEESLHEKALSAHNLLKKQAKAHKKSVHVRTGITAHMLTNLAENGQHFTSVEIEHLLDDVEIEEKSTLDKRFAHETINVIQILLEQRRFFLDLKASIEARTMPASSCAALRKVKTWLLRNAC